MSPRQTPLNNPSVASAQPLAAALLADCRQLIAEAKQSAAVAVNASLTLMYWQIGKRIREEILGGERAEYGKQILPTLSKTLVSEYGRSFEEKNLRRMLQFAELFTDREIVVTLTRQLSWSHFLALLPLKDALQRQFYIEMCCIEHWSVRTLRGRIESLLFERTALSSKPESLIEIELNLLRDKSELAPAFILKDPYVLDFLGLTERYLEKDLEDAILRELETFLLELGSGFSFVARQYRLQIDDDDFYIDLLFYNRKLKRLVAIDLKIDNFKAEYKGQMELYLRWLAKYEQEAGENPPLGIILCTGKKQEQIELLELDGTGIHVAEYLTELPPKALLEQRLHQAMENARRRLDNKSKLEQ
jgi:predicted nuclease of restriction endonuclease-like (RecB) superfamily